MWLPKEVSGRLAPARIAPKHTVGPGSGRLTWGLTTENSIERGATTWSERLSSVREVDNRQNQIAHSKPGTHFPFVTEN